jgi:hypothetical protein
MAQAEAELELASRALTERLGAEAVRVEGKRVLGYADEPLAGPSVVIPPQFFRGSHPLFIDMEGATSPVAWQMEAYLSKSMDGEEGLLWADIRLCADDVMKAFPASDGPATALADAPAPPSSPEPTLATPARARVVSMIGAETRLEVWLTKMMKANPGNPQGKAAIVEAAALAGHKVSVRGFKRAWANAVRAADAPAWSAAGRKSKR